jgi:hypothetical protein
MYDVRFDIESGYDDDEGNLICESPCVYITRDDGDILRVYEDPIPSQEPTYWETTEWEAGEFAKKVLALLREHG